VLLASAAACRRASGWVSESIVLAGVDFVKALRERGWEDGVGKPADSVRH
jgi:hypothetical protein